MEVLPTYNLEFIFLGRKDIFAFCIFPVDHIYEILGVGCTVAANQRRHLMPRRSFSTVCVFLVLFIFAFTIAETIAKWNG